MSDELFENEHLVIMRVQDLMRLDLSLLSEDAMSEYLCNCIGLVAALCDVDSASIPSLCPLLSHMIFCP